MTLENRLWIFKSEDGGVSWDSRGIMVGATKTYDPGGLAHNAFDVDADGERLYIAVLSANLPQILKMSVDLDANALLTFNPGAGSEVNLMAGDIVSYWVWAVGDFGGTDKVVLTTDTYYWYVEDDGTFGAGAARPILVGPGNDSLLTTSVGLSFWQNRYESDTIYWIERYIPGEIWSVDRVDLDVEETVIGAYWYPALVNYSPNSGFNWQDLGANLPTAPVTSVIALR